MKKLFTTVLTVLASGAVFALPVGNPSEASLLCDGLCWEGHCGDFCDPGMNMCEAFSVRIGFYGDYCFNRNLGVSDLPGESNAMYDHSRVFTNAGYLAANLWDRVDIFGTLGASNWYLDGNGSAFTLGAPSAAQGSWVEVASESSFSWSIGARATLWECGCTSLGVEGQYFQFRPNVHSVNMFNGRDGNGAVVGLVNPANIVTSKYQEYQIGVGLSHRIHCFVPYIAVKWANAKISLDDAVVGDSATRGSFVTLYNADANKVWGYAVGCSIVDCEKAAITGEARFGDEAAVSITGQFRF